MIDVLVQLMLAYYQSRARARRGAPVVVDLTALYLGRRPPAGRN